MVSGVFPAPSSAGDNVAYGYDDAIPPRDYDPRLALILKVLTQRQLKAEAERKDEEGRLSRICPQCGFRMYRQGRTWTCSNCGFSYVD